MISTVVQKRTFDLVAGGQRVLYFRHKPHWDTRFRTKPRAIILLNGRRCRAQAGQPVEDTGHSYQVVLGEEIHFWGKQETLPLEATA
jgi:hypothetical protein